MLFIVSNFTVLIEDNNIFFHALFGRDFFDLEDALQIACAEHAQLDYIVTENMRDFKHSKIPAVSIGDFVHKIMQ